MIPILSLLLLSFASPVFAAQDAAVEALETLRRNFADTTDFTAAITQEKQLTLMKRKLVAKGVVKFRKPARFYMELYPPHPSRLLLDGNVMTMRLPEQQVTERIVLPPEESLQRWLTYLARPVTTLPEGVKVTAVRQGKEWSMRLVPQGKGGVEELRLKFDVRGTIRQLVIGERNGDRTTINFSDLRRNVGLNDKDLQLE